MDESLWVVQWQYYMNIFLHSEHFLGHKSLSHIEAKILVSPPVSFFHNKHWVLAKYMAIWCGSGQYLSNLPLVEVPFKRRSIPFFHLCPSCLLEFGHDNWSSGGHFGQWDRSHPRRAAQKETDWLLPPWNIRLVQESLSLDLYTRNKVLFYSKLLNFSRLLFH